MLKKNSQQDQKRQAAVSQEGSQAKSKAGMVLDFTAIDQLIVAIEQAQALARKRRLAIAAWRISASVWLDQWEFHLAEKHYWQDECHQPIDPQEIVQEKRVSRLIDTTAQGTFATVITKREAIHQLARELAAEGMPDLSPDVLTISEILRQSGLPSALRRAQQATSAALSQSDRNSREFNRLLRRAERAYQAFTQVNDSQSLYRVSRRCLAALQAIKKAPLEQ
ncbi:hypothetical protein [Limosilactobacillus mucosae]|uniref:hypothetical protein n=1 Tax=Limosilactobacillus mucosae TaxID=97478 RepID=UPI0039924A1B